MKRQRLRPILALLLSLLLTLSSMSTALPAADAVSPAPDMPQDAPGRPITLPAAEQSLPWLSLRDGTGLPTTYTGTADLVRALEKGLARPLSLAAGDFDEDGVPDLVSGYVLPPSPAGQGEEGILALHRGNVDAIYPNTPAAQRRKAEGTFTAAPFLSPAQVFAIPVAPDFLGVGDFDADGHRDIVAAARGDDALYLLLGNGQGSFGLPRATVLPGKVTALVVGEINRRDGLADVVVGVAGPAGPQVLVFEGSQGALRSAPETFPAPAEVTALALGQLDDHYAIDLAVAAGHELLIVHGRDRKLSLDATQRTAVPPATVDRTSLPFTITALATGDFVPEQGYRLELALLAEDGVVHLLNPVTTAEITQHVIRNTQRGIRNPQLIRAKVSSLPADDLIVIDPANRQLHILADNSIRNPQFPIPNPQSPAPGPVTLDAESEPVAVLPMRLNKDALSDLVILESGSPSPVVVQTGPASLFVVNTTLDYEDCNPGNGICDPGTWNEDHTVCTPVADICTLRAAIQEANAKAGADEIQFSFVAQPIQPNSALPDIEDALTIDGTTNTYTTQLDGSNAGSGANGLSISASNCVVRGMVINNFKSAGLFDGFGIAIFGNNNIIEGNYLGTNKDGTAAQGNENGGIATANGTSGNTIGGTTEAARNLISGNGGYGGHGVQIGESSGGSTNNTVIGNYIGTDVTGSQDLGNDMVGVMVTGGSTNNTIGGTDATRRNIISGNNGHGVAIQNNSTGNLVQGNYIGTNVTGTVAIPNGVFATTNGVGVQIVNASDNTIGGTTTGARNVIAGNYWTGVEISQRTTQMAAGRDRYVGDNVPETAAAENGAAGRPIVAFALTPRASTSASDDRPSILSQNSIAASGNQVLGNYIGLKANGTEALSNFESGVLVYNASSNVIGGTTSGSGNVIASNLGNGVTIQADSGQTATGNIVAGNYIGTDKTGTVTDPDGTPGSGDELGNYSGGVVIGNASGNTVGGTEDEARNVIAGNGGYGVYIVDSGATQNKVQGNSIGTDAGGTASLGNSQAGVVVAGGSQNEIGGTGTAGNIIAHNGGPGVIISNTTDIRNKILGNPIFLNAGRAIDLGNDGVTLNDSGDADAGANNLQNFPVITAVSGNIVTGTLNSTPNTTFRLEFFSYKVCDVNPIPGFGEAKDFLVSQDVQTDADGNVTFTVTLPAAPAQGYTVAATATDPDGNTSELSNTPFHLRASTPSFIPQSVFTPGHTILLYTVLDEVQADALAGCVANLDMYVVVNGDTNNPLKMENDGSGRNSRPHADFNANDVHHSLWFTPTQNAVYTLDLYVAPAGQGFDQALLSDRLQLSPIPNPYLAVLTDFRELFREFNQTSANSATNDTNNNHILDYYEAVERVYQYAAKHRGTVFDVRQDAYTQDYNYTANTQTRVNMGKDIDARIIALVSKAFRLDLEKVAIIGDDAVVPFYRVAVPGSAYDETDYPTEVDGTAGLNTGADGNPTLSDTASGARGYIMSDVPYGTIRTALVDYPIPPLDVGRIFYETPLELVQAIDAYEQPVDLRRANSRGSAVYLNNESNGIQWVRIFHRAIRPVLCTHYGRARVQDNVPSNRPRNFQDGWVYLYNGSGPSPRWDHATAQRAANNTDLMLFYSHADHLSWQTEGSRIGQARARDLFASDLANASLAVAMSTGCHSGYSTSYEQTTNHRYYNNALVRAMLDRHVAYFAPTTYGTGDDNRTTHHDLLIKTLLTALFDRLRSTVGDAYHAAFARYTASGMSRAAKDLDKYVLYSWHLYGLPTQPLRNRAGQTNLRVSRASTAPLSSSDVQTLASASITATEVLTISHFAVTFDEAGRAVFDIPHQGGRGGEDFGPLLPAVYRTYPLPLEATDISVTVVQTQTHLYPTPVELRRTRPVGFSFGPLTGTFTMTNPYPASILEQWVVTDVGGVNLLLTLLPLQYNPDTRQVTLYDRLVYRITYQAPTTVTVQSLTVNDGNPVSVGAAGIPVTLTLNSSQSLTGTLIWAVEDGTGTTIASDLTDVSLATGVITLGWDLDTTDWTPGLVHLWVAVQDSEGKVIASGWTDFTAAGESLTAEPDRDVYSGQDGEAVVKAYVRDATGAGVSGRSGDLQLWLNGNLTGSSWQAGADGLYTTTVGLGALSAGGQVFSVTLGSLTANGSFVIDRSAPTSTVWLTATDTTTTVWAFVGWGDDATGPTVITVEYRVDDGDWQVWRTFRPGYATGEDAVFGPTDPVTVDLTRHSYYFRSQAVDGAGHQEPEHTLPDAHAPRIYTVWLPLIARNYQPGYTPIHYVKRYGDDSGDCSTPATACGSIQYAIDQAADGDEIRIAGYTDVYTGTGSSGSTRWTYWYTEQRPAPDGYDGPSEITQVAYVDKSITLRGGYSSDFSTWDPNTYRTVLRGNSVARAVFVAPGASPTLEWLYIIEGNADYQGGYPWLGGYTGAGGGIYAAGAFGGSDTITVSHCIIADNVGDSDYNGLGGGVYLEYRNNATLTHNTFRGNIATNAGGPEFGGGGGLDLYSCPGAVIEDNVFVGNMANTGYGRGLGAAIYAVSSDNLTLRANEVYSNTGNESGAIEVRFSDNVVVHDNTVYNNVAARNRDGFGGGLNLHDIEGLSLQGNKVYSNTATQSTSTDSTGIGGGVYLNWVEGAVVSGNVITGNVANRNYVGTGGGLSIYGSSDVLVSQNIIRGNVATPNSASGSLSAGGGGRISFNSIGITLTNNIIVQNQAPAGGDGIILIGNSALPVTATLLHNTVADNGGQGGLTQQITPPATGTEATPLSPADAASDEPEHAELRLLSEARSLPLRRSGVAAQADAQGILVGAYATLSGVNTIVSGHTLGISVTYPASSTVTMDHTLWNNTTDYSSGVTHTNDRSGDPAFVNPTAGDYHIGAASAAIDQGVDAGVSTDIDGDARPQGSGYDIGADEYTSGAASTGDLRPLTQALIGLVTLVAVLLWSGRAL